MRTLRPRVRLSAGAALVAAGLAAACARPAQPGRAGTYPLERVNGKTLPYAQSTSLDTPGACRASIVRGTLTIQPDDHFQLAYEAQDACNRAGIVDTETKMEHASGALTREGHTLRFLPVGPDSTAVMMGPAHGDTLSLYYQTRGLTFTFVRARKGAQN